MRRAQIILYDVDGRLETLLCDPARTRGWRLRAVRHPTRALNLLRQGESSVVVLRIGRDLEREFAVLERIASRFPEAATVVVGDSDQPRLAGLAWDLGARFVLFPPQPREQLPEIVSSLMTGHE